MPLPPGISANEQLYWAVGSWYPDSTRFVASASVRRNAITLWSIPILGGEAQKLAEVEDMFGGGASRPTVPTLPTKGCGASLERAKFG